jgi:hypothetical protein
MKVENAWEMSGIILSTNGTETTVHETSHSFELTVRGSAPHIKLLLSLAEAEDLATNLLNICQEYRRMDDENQ